MTRFCDICEKVLDGMMVLFAIISIGLAILQAMGVDWWPLLMGIGK